MKSELTLGSYTTMIRSCYDQSFKGYDLIGKKGITVCDYWRASFNNFLSDMGERPAGFRMVRKDREGNYNKENCVWRDSREYALEKGHIKMTDDLIRKLLNMVHKDGKKIDEICHLFPVKRQQLKTLAYGYGYRLPDYDYPLEKRGNKMPVVKLTKEDREQIVRRAATDESHETLAQQYGVTRRYIRKLAEASEKEELPKRRARETRERLTSLGFPDTPYGRRLFVRESLAAAKTRQIKKDGLDSSILEAIDGTQKLYDRLTDVEIMDATMRQVMSICRNNPPVYNAKDNESLPEYLIG
jgi:uncharacterized protein (DUF433 family)